MVDGFKSTAQTSQPSEVECNPKVSISFLEVGEGWWMESITQPGQSSEVEHNPKTSISFFEAGEGWWMGFESIAQPESEMEIQKFMFQAEKQGGSGVDCLNALAELGSKFQFGRGEGYTAKLQCHCELKK